MAAENNVKMINKLLTEDEKSDLILNIVKSGTAIRKSHLTV